MRGHVSRQNEGAYALGWITSALDDMDDGRSNPDDFVESIRALRDQLIHHDPAVAVADCPVCRPGAVA